MTDPQDPIRERFIHEIGELAASLGLSRSVGQLYALLYMSPEPLCLDELAEVGQMSKASASVNMRELERWGAARKVWGQGDRKDYYEANRDLSEIVIRRLQDGLGRRLERFADAVDQAQNDISEMTDPETRGFYEKRLEEIRTLHGRLDKALSSLDKIYGIARRML